jgi:hypothetical protein
LCGIADVMCAAMHVLMINRLLDPLGLRRFTPANGVWDIGVLALAAGACAIAVGLWNSGRTMAWLLSLHGLALGAFGLIGVSPLVRGPLGFRPVSLLFVLMAVSLGAYAFGAAQSRKSSVHDRWFFTLCGAALLGYACSFIAVGFGWVRLEPWYSYWIWMSSYFAFTALCMLRMALSTRACDSALSLRRP